MNHLVLLWGLLRTSDYGEWARDMKVNVAREIGLITVYSRVGSAEYLDLGLASVQLLLMPTLLE
jgi:hypothetical protein